MEEVDKELEDPNVWGDPDRAQALGKERASLEAVIRTLDRIDSALDEAQELFSLAEEERDSGTLADVAEEVAKVNRAIEGLEFRRMFAGEMDRHNAYLDIQSGSGGTEAQDWADMLLRMYLRWAESRGFEAEILELSPGEIAGIKSATVQACRSRALPRPARRVPGPRPECCESGLSYERRPRATLAPYQGLGRVRGRSRWPISLRKLRRC